MYQSIKRIYIVPFRSLLRGAPNPDLTKHKSHQKSIDGASRVPREGVEGRREVKVYLYIYRMALL